MGPSSHYLTCERREIHYTEWGAGHDEVVIAWHGLARTGRDMDPIAAATVARAMRRALESSGPGVHVIESGALQTAGREDAARRG